MAPRTANPRDRACRTFGRRGAERRNANRLGEMPETGDGVEIFGLFGLGIQYSHSPVIQEAALREAGRDARYLLWPVTAEEFPQALRGAYLLGVRGANVTIPHKEAALRRAIGASPLALRIGAANVLQRAEGGFVAHNTDAEGFWRPLADRGMRPQRALVLGAGGAARAVTAALLERGTKVIIAARDPVQAVRIVGDLGGGDAAAWPGLPGDYDLVVNATPIGRTRGEVPVDPARIPGHAVVYDLVYGATDLQHGARARGCTVIGGEEMLVEQAALSFEIWFGAEAPRNVMRAALDTAMRRG